MCDSRATPRGSGFGIVVALRFWCVVCVVVVVGCSSQDRGRSGNAESAHATTTNPSKESIPSLKVSTYLLFDGNCKEAMEFYRTVLGGELSMTKVGDSPMRDVFPAPMHGRIVNARLKSGSVDLSASDWLRPAEKPVIGNTVCLYLSGGTREETEGAFRMLSEGANVTDPLGVQPFGVYGTLNDKFGVRWMFRAENR